MPQNSKTKWSKTRFLFVLHHNFEALFYNLISQGTVGSGGWVAWLPAQKNTRVTHREWKAIRAGATKTWKEMNFHRCACVSVRPYACVCACVCVEQQLLGYTLPSLQGMGEVIPCRHDALTKVTVSEQKCWKIAARSGIFFFAHFQSTEIKKSRRMWFHVTLWNIPPQSFFFLRGETSFLNKP